ncbi:MAG: transcriptional regulator [Elusimicrobia bacterium]|nr:transcriptional regulator [Elusimicrobiota bacterium]
MKKKDSSIKAKLDFDMARYKSFINFIKTLITNESNDLIDFETLRKQAHIKSEYYKGMETVPVEKIVGSQGRFRDFDNLFLPKHDHIRDRWENIDKAHYDEIPLPAVSLYKIGDTYYVRDGNHRVSVARQRGIDFIDAEVIEIESLIKFDKPEQINKKILEYELKEFFRITGLDTYRPVNNIEIKIIGNYEILIKHIEVHKYFLGEKEKADIDYKKAVCNWYDFVYLPLVELIKKEKLASNFPKAGLSDLYIWITEHWHYLKEQYGQYLEPSKAIEDFKKKYSSNKFFNSWNILLYILNIINKFIPIQENEKIKS